MHAAIDEREQGVVAAAADADTRMHLGAALADQDVAGDHRLAAEFFHAETLAARVASVFDGALSFFMGHESGKVSGGKISPRSRSPRAWSDCGDSPWSCGNLCGA